MVWGALAFLGGIVALLSLGNVSDRTPQRHLFELNALLGTAALYLALGGFMVVQAASALGSTGSSPMRLRIWPWCILPLFPLFVVLGQLIVNHPERTPWLFPFVNIGVVSIPSLFVAATVARRYRTAHPFAWPVSWREWTSGFAYGAVGATSVAGLINTGYLYGMGALLVHTVGRGPIFPLDDSLPLLPRGWGIFLDLTSLSLIAPLNEEFWKGFLVALFFFRRGGLARCFFWGVLAGSGFNLLETFINSLGAVDPDVVARQRISDDWWLFAVSRGGTALIHACATGFSAIGIYGMLRRRWRLALCFPAGMFVHGSWNFLAYCIDGDAFFSRAGPDTTALDILGLVGMVVLALGAAVTLFALSGRLRDELPGVPYRLIGMLPRRAGAAGVPTAERQPVAAAR